ncbi:1440_t:CDS:2 [Entrophospora sp. SA101]|nr:1440_t:CDS:2 [Entrophospora sp. SA101]CAJ0863498.1 14018_t:CDS:2 [Entrophospora sp. SA101]
MLKSKITAKRTCNAISVKLKKEICEYMMVHQNKDKWLNLVSDTIGLDKFCQCSTRFPEFDKAMQIWTAQMVSARMPLSDLILQRKGGFARGLNIENQIKCANGWIYKFKKRNGLHKIKYSGEANSAPLQILPEERSKLRFILSQYNEDIYNADEMGIFFRMLPNQTLKYLNDEEIISLVQFEEMGENGNDSSLDEEIPLILVKKCN